MTAVAASLADLVRMLNDGIQFYSSAAGKVSDVDLASFFGQMANLKRRIADDLNAEIVEQGEPPLVDGSLMGVLRKAYADTLAALSDDTAQQYVSQLEEHEDRLLAAFREAVLGDSSSQVRELALRYFPEVETMHARMRTLKQRQLSG